MAALTPYSADNLYVRRMEGTEDLTSFSCGVEILDNFFKEEAAICRKYKYFTPYSICDATDGSIAGLFTLAADTIVIRGIDEKEDFILEAGANIPEEYVSVFLHQSSFPAVNIGHLAVARHLQGKGIGTFVVDYLIQTFLRFNTFGCQFLTVDSLNNPRTNAFYLRSGFFNQTDFDRYCPTRRMFLPLLWYRL